LHFERVKGGKKVYILRIYSICVKNAKNGVYPWVILGESLGYPLVMSLFRPYFELDPTRKGSMTVHRTLPSRGGKGKGGWKKRGTRGCVPLWDPPDAAETF